ncbi:MAG TPA: hypothetical protein VGA00_01180 [Acidiferrobacterales bacterium]
MLAMLPLFMLLPVLGKLSDMNESAIIASRYMAWERTLASPAVKSDAEIRDEMRKRMFADSRLFIATGDAPDQADAAQHVSLWSQIHPERPRLLENFSDVNMGIREDRVPGNASDLLYAAKDLLTAFDSDDRFNVNTAGLYRADVDVKTGFQPQGSDSLLRIRRHMVILADGWAASAPSGGPDSAAERVRGMVPTDRMNDMEIERVTSLLGSFPLTQEIRGFEAGAITPEIVPPDRLGDRR